VTQYLGKQGKEIGMEEMERVTVNRLIEWLEKHGHTEAEILDCIRYITGSKKPSE
jgi:hypothetical protein